MNQDSDDYNGTETILLVDDEEIVRNMFSSILESCGYKVILAVDGQDAIEKYNQFIDSIDLVITDVAMPRKDGISVYKEIKSINQNSRILLMSGYLPPKLDIKEDVTIIEKPFSPYDIIVKIRKTLDSVESFD
jgi:CheY-like chemotaxis protein